MDIVTTFVVLTAVGAVGFWILATPGHGRIHRAGHKPAAHGHHKAA